MPKFSIVGKFETRPETHSAFEELIRNHASKCLEIESGTLRFEVHHPVDEGGKVIPNSLVVNELFEDASALDFHINTDRLKQVAAQFDSMTVSHWFITSQVES